MTNPPAQPNPPTGPLAQQEIDEINRFLRPDDSADRNMTFGCLDGYLTAIVIGPTVVKVNEWLPGIWGLRTKDDPAFETREEAQHVLELIMRHIKEIVGSFSQDPDQFQPVFDRVNGTGDTQEYPDGGMWAQGFLRGVKLRAQEWKPFMDDPEHAAVLRPIHLLGAEEVGAEEKSLMETPAQREALTRQIPASVAAMYRHWLSHSDGAAVQMKTGTFRRDQPKVGRNDPCPCGSGKKFKKCCGATPTLH